MTKAAHRAEPGGSHNRRDLSEIVGDLAELAPREVALLREMVDSAVTLKDLLLVAGYASELRRTGLMDMFCSRAQEVMLEEGFEEDFASELTSRIGQRDGQALARWVNTHFRVKKLIIVKTKYDEPSPDSLKRPRKAGGGEGKKKKKANNPDQRDQGPGATQ